MRFGQYISSADMSVMTTSQGTPGAGVDTYVNNDTMDHWRVRTHDGGSNFVTGLDLRFGEEALYGIRPATPRLTSIVASSSRERVRRCG